MKQLKQILTNAKLQANKLLQKLFRTAAIPAFAGAAALATSPAYAGLSKAKGLLDGFEAQLLTIIPVASAILLIGFGIGYAAKMIEKDTFVRWAVGILICGSAVELTALFFS